MGAARLYDQRMHADAQLLQVDPADPTWYLLWDLAGTWIGSLGSAAAAIAAVWLGLSAVRGQREQVAQQLRTQAEQVNLTRLWQPVGVVLQVRNYSSRAITAVRVITEDAQIEAVNDARSYRDVIGPGEVAEISFEGVSDTQTMAALEFDDAAGQTWIRISDGQLAPVTRDQRRSCLAVAYSEDLPEVVDGIAIRIRPGIRPYRVRRGEYVAGMPPRRIAAPVSLWQRMRSMPAWRLNHFKRRRRSEI
jgi:hypothetical protein